MLCAPILFNRINEAKDMAYNNFIDHSNNHVGLLKDCIFLFLTSAEHFPLTADISMSFRMRLLKKIYNCFLKRCMVVQSIFYQNKLNKRKNLFTN